MNDAYKTKIRELEEQLEKQREPLKKGTDALSAFDTYNRTYSDLVNYLKPREHHGHTVRLPDVLRGQISHALDRTAINFPALNCQLGEAVAPYIDLDFRSYALLDYWGIGLFYNKQYADARAIFHCSVRPPYHLQQNETKETKETNETKEIIKNEDKKDQKHTFRKLPKRASVELEEDDTKQTDVKWSQVGLVPDKSYAWSISEQHHGNIKHIWDNTQHPLHAMKQPPISADDRIKVHNPKPFRTQWKLLHETQWKSPKLLPAKYHIFNPCMIPHPTEKGKILMNLRCGNYHMNMEKLGKGSIYEYETRVHTLNYLVTMDPYWRGDDFGSKHGVMIKEEPVPFPGNIAGCEDIRLVWNDEKGVMYAVFTSLEHNKEGRPEICLATLDWKKGKFTSPVVRCRGPAEARIEKNWIGFVFEGRLYFIYSMNDIVVLEVNPETGESRFASYDICTRHNAWRGSSPPFLLDEHPSLLEILKEKIPQQQRTQHMQPKDKWMLMMVHISAFPQYSHCMVVFRLRPTPNTHRPFTLQALFVGEIGVFRQHDVEFTCSVQITPDSKELILPFAMRDEYMFCDRYDAESVFQTLKWIGSPDDLVVVSNPPK